MLLHQMNGKQCARKWIMAFGVWGDLKRYWHGCFQLSGKLTFNGSQKRFRIHFRFHKVEYFKDWTIERRRCRCRSHISLRNNSNSYAHFAIWPCVFRGKMETIQVYKSELFPLGPPSLAVVTSAFKCVARARESVRERERDTQIEIEKDIKANERDEQIKNWNR